jgi:hypothetical protein
VVRLTRVASQMTAVVRSLASRQALSTAVRAACGEVWDHMRRTAAVEASTDERKALMRLGRSAWRQAD